MNNEENKNQDLNYDFDFENQVVKNEQERNTEVEVLNDAEFEELEEVNEINDEGQPKIEEFQEEILEENNQTADNEPKIDDTSNKKVKILGKEFLFEDVVLVVIGIVIIASIFLLPKIMKLFS